VLVDERGEFPFVEEVEEDERGEPKHPLGQISRLAEGRRLAGAVVGKALYEGAFGVEQALAATATSG
jgi:hypothetical protein